MTGELMYNGEAFYVLYCTGSEHWKVFFLLPNSTGDWAYNKGVKRVSPPEKLMVDFEIVRWCSNHKTTIKDGPCTFDCAGDEVKYADIIFKCDHSYSKAMNQLWPRLCIKCKKPELVIGQASTMVTPYKKADDIGTQLNATWESIIEKTKYFDKAEFIEMLKANYNPPTKK